MRILEVQLSSGVRRNTDGISTLQDLYALLWREVILVSDPESPQRMIASTSCD